MIKIKGIDSYYGGKGSPGTYQTIINHIRPCKKLIIPFLGNCAVTRHIRTPEQGIIGIDLDQKYISLWQAMDFSWISLMCVDGIDYLKNFVDQDLSDIVIYCDPPYLKHTRKSDRYYYYHELKIRDHERLLKIIKKLSCDVLISTYENTLYSKYLKSWNCIFFHSMTRGGLKEELLYMNYTNPEGVLHDYSYLGKNFRERERIQRKIKRWTNRLKKLPVKECNAILSAFKNTG